MNNAQARNMALGQLITNEIRDPRILRAMTSVPREHFVPERLAGSAYVDDDLHIGGGRYLMAPLTFAKLLACAQIMPEHRVLNVGALAGYTAVVIARLASHVVATEIDEGLAQYMRDSLPPLGVHNVDVEQVANMADGYALSSPYDVIIVSGGVRSIPHALSSQLSLSGRLVAVSIVAGRPDIRGGMGRGIVVQRQHDRFYATEHFDAAAVLLPGFGD